MSNIIDFEVATLKLVKDFERKQECYFEFFVGDDCTGIASFGDVNYINISDIYHDLKTKQPKGLIFNWIDDCLENENKKINYSSYCMGLRFEDIKD